jgi:hypothetical protein
MSADTCVELAKLAASRHDERRKYEWKISLAFWGLIIGAAIKKQEFGELIKAWQGVILILLYVFVWLRGLWVANENDKSLWMHYLKEAEEYLKNRCHNLVDAPERTSYKEGKFWFGFLRDWAMIFHILVSALLMWVYFQIDP